MRIFGATRSILSNLVRLQLLAIGLSLCLLFSLFYVVSESTIKAERESRINQIRVEIDADQERLRAWKYMGMELAVEQATTELVKKFRLDSLQVGLRADLQKNIDARSFLLPKDPDATLDEDFVLLARLPKLQQSLVGSVNTYVMFFLLLLIVSFSIILIWSARYVKVKILKPFQDLVAQFEVQEKTKNFYLSSIPAEAEVGSIIDRVIQTYNLSKKRDEERARFQLARQVAHDIKSPLLALDVATEDLDGLSETSRVLIVDSVQRISDIANNLLSQSGQTETAAGPIYLDCEIEKLVSEKRTRYRDHKGLEIEFLSVNAGSELFSTGHASKFRRSLSNLINNAIEAMGGRGKLQISLEAHSKDSVCIRVIDNGCGIPADKLQRIAERGYSFNKKGGHGLGLSYAKESIEEMGGQLQIFSQPEKGTEVQLLLPRCPAPAIYRLEIDVSPYHRFVFVDDYDNVLDIWRKKLLENAAIMAGIETLFFTNLAEFRNWLARQEVSERDLFFIDYHFNREQIRGTDVIGEFSLGQRAILVSSQFDHPHVVERCKALGVGILPKQKITRLQLRRDQQPSILGRDDKANTAGERAKSWSERRQQLEIALANLEASKSSKVDGLSNFIEDQI